MFAILVLQFTFVATVIGAGVGCFNASTIFEGREVAWDVSGPFDAVECRITCAAAGSIYGYTCDNYGGGPGTYYINCYCTDEQPDFQYLADGGYDTCWPDYWNPSIRVFTVEQNNWGGDGCHPPISSTVNELAMDNIFECFEHCNNHRFARIYYAEGSSEGNCACY